MSMAASPTRPLPKRSAPRSRAVAAAAREGEALVSGAAEDYAAYKHQVGIIRGLNIAHELIEIVNDEIHKAEQGSK